MIFKSYYADKFKALGEYPLDFKLYNYWNIMKLVMAQKKNIYGAAAQYEPLQSICPFVFHKIQPILIIYSLV